MTILRLLTSQSLPCGCLAGVYQSYTGEVITLLDGRDERCQSDDHREGRSLHIPSPKVTISPTPALPPPGLTTAGVEPTRDPVPGPGIMWCLAYSTSCPPSGPKTTATFRGGVVATRFSPATRVT